MLGKLRVITADDHVVIRLGLRTMVAASGVGEIVAEAEGPEALISLLSQVPCDLLITDLSMPAQAAADGNTMLALILRRYPTLPVVLLTMVSSIETIRGALATGVRGVVEKAAAAEELPAALRAIAAGGDYISTRLRERLEAGPRICGRTPIRLTPRESEVMRLLASGLNVKQASERLNRTIATVSRQKRSAMDKLAITTDIELFEYMRRSGLVAEF